MLPVFLQLSLTFSECRGKILPCKILTTENTKQFIVDFMFGSTLVFIAYCR